MGFEIQLIRTSALDKGLTEGTDFKFTCHGSDMENLGAHNRKEVFDKIMTNATSEFIIVGGIPLTEDYTKKYSFTYMTYESVLAAIYKPAPTDRFFFLQSGFESMYLMLVVAIMAAGTFLTIYEMGLMPIESADNPNAIAPSVLDEWFKNAWISWLLLFNLNHKLYLKLPSRIIAIFAKIVSVFLFAIYIGFIFKKMHTTFIKDKDLSTFFGMRGASEDIFRPWYYNMDFNIVPKSPYDMQ